MLIGGCSSYVSTGLLMRSVVSVCCVLVTYRFQSPPLDSPAMGEKEAEYISLPCQYIASQ